jgi:antitoxin PrlF
MGVRATLSTKGQLTLPVVVRDSIGLRAGDQVDIDILPDGTLHLRRLTGDLSGVIGRLQRYATAIPVGAEDIEAARQAEYSERAAR